MIKLEHVVLASPEQMDFIIILAMACFVIMLSKIK